MIHDPAAAPSPTPLDDMSPDTRAMREPGRRMRSHLLNIAVALFKARGLAGVSVSDIATGADAFPSQVTYYFRSKEALFVEAACREILYTGQQAEAAAASAPTVASYTRALVASVVASPGLPLFIEALALSRRRQDLAPLIERTFERLHTEGDRAYGAVRDARGWPHDADPALRARRFWALALGCVLRGAATGASAEHCAADMLALLIDDTTPAARPAKPPTLFAVNTTAQPTAAPTTTQSGT